MRIWQLVLLSLAYSAIWLVSLVSLCRRRDIDIHAKISWLVAMLVLNGLGAIIYLLFGPKREYPAYHPHGFHANDREALD